MRRLLLVLVLLAWAVPASAAMTCSPTNVSAVAINTSSSAPTVAMPTSAPAGATIFVALRNRTDTDVPTISGSVNGSLTIPANGSGGNSTNIVVLAYKVNASAGTDTFTATFGGLKSSQMIAFWCADDAGAQTFDVAATVATVTGTNHDSNTLSAAGGGGIVGVLGTNNSVTFTADGAGETEISGDAAGQRLGVFFEPYTGAGTYGLEVTSSASATSYFVVEAFLTPSGGATCTGGLLLLGAGKCE